MNVLLPHGLTITDDFDAKLCTGVAMHSAEHARAMLDRHAGDTDVMRLLRAVATPRTYLMARQCDDVIVAWAARALVDGTLRLHAGAPAPVATYAACGRQAAAAPVPTRAPVRAAQPLPAARGRTATAIEEAEIQADMHADVDQDAQAATLVRAAADGTPFCAVCERIKAAAAARDAVLHE